MANNILLIAALCAVSLFAHAQPVPVSVERLGDLRVDRELRAPATVLSANNAVVTSEVTALIEEILADVGTSVEKGALLVRLDNNNARLALEHAKATLAALDAQIVQAQQRLRKAEDLLERDFVSDDELIARQTDLAVLEANRQGQVVSVQIAELALERTRVLAPFAATVVQRSAQVGSFAQPGTPLLILVQTDRREVDVELDPRYAVHIPRVSNLRYLSQGREYPVELARLSDVIETNTRKLRARLKFTGDAAPIGSSGQLVWNEDTGVVPVTLIVQRGSSFGIFAATAGKAKFIPIPEAQEGRPAAVDLPDDTQVVSRGHVRLQDGDAIQIIGE